MGIWGRSDGKKLGRVLSGFLGALGLCTIGGLLAMPRGAIAHGSSAPVGLPAAGVSTAPTTLAPTTTVTAAPAPTTVPKRPISVPADSYAPEAIQRVGTIQIPKLGVSAPMYNGVTLWNIDQGPSHWPGTAFPGQPGNAVIAGHRVTHSHPFLHIDQLVPGDQVIFNAFGWRSVYVVTGHEVVRPTDLAIIAQTPTPTATLYACHPPHSAEYRYVVHLAIQSGPVLGG